MYRQALLSGLLALTLSCTSVVAQTDAPPPGAPADNSQSGPPAGGPGPGEPMAGQGDAAPMSSPRMGMGSRRAINKAIIASCRSRASARGLIGHQRRQAVLACVRAKKPHLAARMICRHKGKMAGLHAHSAQLHAYVRRCLGKSI
jgi:hypothetical protein